MRSIRNEVTTQLTEQSAKAASNASIATSSRYTPTVPEVAVAQGDAAEFVNGAWQRQINVLAVEQVARCDQHGERQVKSDNIVQNPAVSQPTIYLRRSLRRQPRCLKDWGRLAQARR